MTTLGTAEQQIQQVVNTSAAAIGAHLIVDFDAGATAAQTQKHGTYQIPVTIGTTTGNGVGVTVAPIPIGASGTIITGGIAIVESADVVSTITEGTVCGIAAGGLADSSTPAAGTKIGIAIADDFTEDVSGVDFLQTARVLVPLLIDLSVTLDIATEA